MKKRKLKIDKHDDIAAQTGTADETKVKCQQTGNGSLEPAVGDNLNLVSLRSNQCVDPIANDPLTRPDPDLVATEARRLHSLVKAGSFEVVVAAFMLGLLLCAAKAVYKYRRFGAWFEAADLGFSKNTRRKYMNLADEVVCQGKSHSELLLTVQVTADRKLAAFSFHEEAIKAIVLKVCNARKLTQLYCDWGIAQVNSSAQTESAPTVTMITTPEERIEPVVITTEAKVELARRELTAGEISSSGKPSCVLIAKGDNQTSINGHLDELWDESNAQGRRFILAWADVKRKAQHKNFIELASNEDDDQDKPSAFRCDECGTGFVDGKEACILYKCERCPAKYTSKISPDGECPACGMPGVELSDFGCPVCPQGHLAPILQAAA